MGRIRFFLHSGEFDGDHRNVSDFLASMIASPLRELAVPADTQVYLGLIHHDDTAGDRRRIDAARAALPSFGVATECGWGRGDPARVDRLLESHGKAVTYLRNALSIRGVS